MDTEGLILRDWVADRQTSVGHQEKAFRPDQIPPPATQGHPSLGLNRGRRFFALQFGQRPNGYQGRTAERRTDYRRITDYGRNWVSVVTVVLH